MDYNSMNQPYIYSEEYAAEPLGKYTAKTFGWMFAGLLVTFLVSFFGYATGTIIYVFSVPYAYLLLGVAEIAVVLFLLARISKMSVGTARALFFTYAVLNGIVFSAYFLMYAMADLILVFGATSVFFGVMAVIGYTTGADFSRFRNFLIGGLIFLAAFWVLSMFLNLGQFEMIVCYIGIFIFLGFTAYDTQKIKAYHQYYAQDPDMAAKASIFSALQLYLDFVNLFLYIIRIIGRRK